LLMQRIAVLGLSAAAQACGISARAASKWQQRFEDQGPSGLYDRSSRPRRTQNTIDAELAQRLKQLRRARMPIRKIATVVGRSVATVSRFLAGLGLSSLKALEPREPVLRYERQAPGELLHVDTKKLGRIVRPGHWVTGDPRDSVTGAEWEFAHVAIDDHPRADFVQMHSSPSTTPAGPTRSWDTNLQLPGSLGTTYCNLTPGDADGEMFARGKYQYVDHFAKRH